MKFREFFIENRIKFLNALIRTQIKQIEEYSHENNIEVGVAYQNALLLVDERMQASSQKFNDVKHDVIYCPLITESEHDEREELKTGFYNFNYRHRQSRKKWGDKCAAKEGRLRCQRVPYRKCIGDSDYFIDEKLPDGLLIYQKYSLKNNVPPAIGFIDKQQLQIIFKEGRFDKTRGDFILKINRDDFKGLFFCSGVVPRVRENELRGCLEQNKLYYREQLELDNNKALDTCLTGDYYKVINGEEGILDGRSLSSPDEIFIRNLANDNFTCVEISVLSGFTIKAVENVLSRDS